MSCRQPLHYSLLPSALTTLDGTEISLKMAWADQPPRSQVGRAFAAFSKDWSDSRSQRLRARMEELSLIYRY